MQTGVVIFFLLTFLAFSLRSALALDVGKLTADVVRLIDEGNKNIIVSPRHKDIILVLGNTGAGKTTITKFIAEVNELEAYDAGDRYLVRDKQQKISVDSTMISKTIFPDLIIDKATNNAFYDLPGFGDTRNASVEIANAWFMKKVAGTAKRVKLLLVVNYESLLTGGTRTAFKTALEHVTELVKNPAKFKSSIGLVATKVESVRPPDTIINGIGIFLEAIKADLPKVFPDSSKRQAASLLVDALLSKDGAGKYNKISFFRQPEDEGPLVKIPEVMKQRPHIVNMIYRNVGYTSISSEDFGFSLSPAGKLITLKVAEKFNQNFRETFGKMAEEMRKHFTSKVGRTTPENIGDLLFEQEKMTELVSKLPASKTRKEFLENFKVLQTYMAKQLTFQGVDVIQNRAEHLNFFEQISNQVFPTPIKDWAHPFTNFANSLKNLVNSKLTVLNNQIQNNCNKMAPQVTTHFRTLVQKTEVKIPKMEATLRALTHANQKLLEMLRSLENSKFIKEFIRNFQPKLRAVAPIPVSNDWPRLNQDIKLSPDKSAPSIFSVVAWLRPLNSVSQFLIAEQSNVKNKIQTEKNRLDRLEGERKAKIERERQQRLEKERQAREKKLREERERRERLERERLKKLAEQQRQEKERKQKQLEEAKRRENEKKKRGGGGWGSFSFSLNIGK
ncbi:unnamed protein product [Allacma fusca]|uniref:G domain-containing protein n=1 Tax=Allacma fusca TaxID=39272 RepID=A0A8J2P5P0_9HEXA|nr:unnamed protein product [Allacma fusca]